MVERQIEIMNYMDEIYTDDPTSGQRKILAELGKTYGIKAGREGHAREPGVEYRHYLHPAQARVRVPDRDYRLVQPPDTCLEAVELAVVGLLRRGAAGSRGQVRMAGGVQYRPGLPIHFGKVHEALRGRKLYGEAVDGWQGPLAGTHPLTTTHTRRYISTMWS